MTPPRPSPSAHPPPRHAAPSPASQAVALAGVVALVVGCAGCPDTLFPGPTPITVPPRVDVVALAGPDLVVLEGSRVVLSGRASRGLAGDASLSWTQVDGAPVLLTNPSSALPAFVAPLAPATLTFELRAEADGAVATDQVKVTVSSTPEGEPAFLMLPPDAVVEPGTSHVFDVDSVGDVASLTATASCGTGAGVTVDGTTVDVTLGATLPCIVVVDGVDGAGRGVAPAARVFWPAGTPLPADTGLTVGTCASPVVQVDTNVGVSVSFCPRDDTGSTARAWSADGNADVIPGGVEGDNIAFSAPRRQQHLFLAGERRLGGASGGVQVAPVDVRPPNGDIAPTANGGPDRIVGPGSRFRLDTSRSFDVDRDPLVVTITQVLGPTAAPDPLVPGLFTAPAGDGPDVTLLFHVVADDGLVISPPDTVRVLVTNGAENVAPVLSLPPERFVVPGEVFVVDARGAEDPDSGVIASTSISQAPDDPVRLLTEATDADHIELTAVAAGDVYHFVISAFDDKGLGVTVEQAVTVEEAGPYVDPVRGDDDAGNGTAAAPFATVAAAVDTAERHELPELLLAEGSHAVFTGALPERLSLRGGLHFDDVAGAYVDGGAETTLPVGSTGVSIVDAHLATLTLSLAGGSVQLTRTSSLDGVHIVEGAVHDEPLLVAAPGAAVRVQDSVVEPTSAHDVGSVVLSPGAVATFVDSAVLGAPGDAAVGVVCTSAVLALERADITGGAGATSAAGVKGTACSLDATASTISGGAADAAVGIEVTDSLLTLDGDTTVAGATADASSGEAIAFAGDARSALVRATLLAAANAAAVDDAVGLAADGAQVSLEGAHVIAEGVASALAVRASGGVLVASGATLVSNGDGMLADGAGDVQLVDTTIDAAGRAAAGSGTATLSLSGVALTAGVTGVDAGGVDVTVVDSTVVVDGAGSTAGIVAASADVSDSTVDVHGADAVAAQVSAPSTFLRSTLRAISDPGAATGLSCGDASLLSSFVSVDGGPAVDATGAVELRQATLVSSGAAVALDAQATLDAANSVLGGDPGIDAATDAPWTQAVALAFSTGATLVVTPSVTALSNGDLAAFDPQCDACLIVDVSALVDDTGHLVTGDNALADAADAALSLADDIDGDPRPQGNRPDIGCDER